MPLELTPPAVGDKEGRNAFLLEIIRQLKALPPKNWQSSQHVVEWRNVLECRDAFMRELEMDAEWRSVLVEAGDDAPPEPSHHTAMAGWHLLMAAKALMPNGRRVARRPRRRHRGH